jgi:surface protein
MFGSCKSLTSLDLSNFDTGNVTDMRYMFNNCKSLTSLDIRNFDTKNVTDIDNMFDACQSLHTLRLDNCSNDTINKIITSYNFPKEAITGVTKTIYCKRANAQGLTPPTNWVFSYID